VLRDRLVLDRAFAEGPALMRTTIVERGARSGNPARRQRAFVDGHARDAAGRADSAFGNLVPGRRCRPPSLGADRARVRRCRRRGRQRGPPFRRRVSSDRRVRTPPSARSAHRVGPARSARGRRRSSSVAASICADACHRQACRPSPWPDRPRRGPGAGDCPGSGRLPPSRPTRPAGPGTGERARFSSFTGCEDAIARRADRRSAKDAAITRRPASVPMLWRWPPPTALSPPPSSITRRQGWVNTRP